ncbi:unnamed protein product [Spirodela intermedia]|uniref:C2 domain-containing protein n=1 Tax=Spirodela intermedia TaxID=51605 RepID=A0A7I8KTK1_SPIIN|nr:unnamed protein product [Spirodela intermedia]
MKLAVEVLDACDLIPKDGQGSASAYVEVEFEGQRHRTQTKVKDLNPTWNETLVFNVADPTELPNRTIEVTVYNDGGAGRKFLGRVRISGTSIAPSAEDAAASRCPLDKRGIFSHIRGDIALRIYALPDPLSPPLPFLDPSLPVASGGSGAADKKGDAPAAVDGKKDEEKKKDDSKATTAEKKPADGNARSFYSMPPGGGGVRFELGQMKATVAAAAMSPAETTVVADRRADYSRAGPMAVPRLMQVPGFGLVETKPSVAARRGRRGGGGGSSGDRISSTFDLVEQMHYLYVSVVKARNLPTGDPYVEVKLGNYRGLTKHREKTQSPSWGQVFAFSKERLQSNTLEVSVKDKDLIKDDLLGRVIFDISEVPQRVPPESPLAPEWYHLQNQKGEKLEKGEVMLAVWIGTQADEAFPDAWHSDAHSVNAEGMVSTRSKVYFSPRLCYLRVHIIQAQDLVPADKSRPPEPYLKLQLGNQFRRTRPSPARSVNATWNEEHMFVAAEPFDEPLMITVEDRLPGGKEESIGKLVVPVELAQKRFDNKVVEPKWFSLDKPSGGEGEKDESKFASKLLLRLCLDMGYHVLDESTHYSSDFRPYNRNLWKHSVGVLELGIIDARNLAPMKAKNGSSSTTDAYCVAKYGPKWVRTRTLLDTVTPRWNEQYTWEVYDPCTVITVGVFDNCHVDGGKDGKDGKEGDDQRIGKVRIRLSTLEANRVYTHYHPLLVLQPSGLKKAGELHLAIRFTCTAWVNMVALYARPPLPKMHYVLPMPVVQLDHLRHQAMQIVASRLARAEPPLRKEAVQYMLDVDSHMFSLRRSKANFHRVVSLLSGAMNVARWFGGICSWKNPATTILVHVLFTVLVCYPELILSTVFLYLFLIGLWNYRSRPRTPPHMDTVLSCADRTNSEELDEEFDSFPSARAPELVRQRYDRLRSVAGRVQTVVGDLATQGERALAILSWRDPRATAIAIILSLFLALFLYVTPFQVVVFIAGIYVLRHPRFRSRMPSVPFNFYRRLPPKSDMLF